MATQQYSAGAFQWITTEKSAIQNTAQVLGISATAIAGAMAKERTLYDLSPTVNYLQDKLIQLYTDAAIRRDYAEVNALGISDTKTTFAEKLDYSTLNDVGYANIKLQTAIRLLDKYQATYGNSDPLGLKLYFNDTGKLASDLAGNALGLASKITGLVIQEADKFYTDHKADNWSGLSLQNRDALDIMYFSSGPSSMVDSYKINIVNNTGTYIPGLDGYRDDDPGYRGGRWHVDNSPQLTQIMGVNYASYITGAAAGTEPSQTAAPNPIAPLTIRPSSSLLIDYADPYTAVLKAGGTLSDIVTIERANGNNITIDDLRKINGLTPDMDTKLQIGQRLVVPEKVGSNLVVNYGDVQLSMNPADGTYTYVINRSDTNTTFVYSRTLDAATGKYQDHFSETDNTTGLPVESVTSPVDPNYASLINTNTTIQKYVDSGSGNIITATTTNDGTTTAVITDPDGQVVSTQVTHNDGLQTLTKALQNGSLIDALSLIKAIQSGQPLPIVASGIRLASDFNQDNATLTGASDVASGILSVMSLENALQRGDTLATLTAGAQALSYGAKVYLDFASSTSVGVATANDIGLFLNGKAAVYKDGVAVIPGEPGVLPYLNLINDISNGDAVGTAIDSLSIANAMGWMEVPGINVIAAAYAVFNIISSLFGDEDPPPEPWGNAWAGWSGFSAVVNSNGGDGGQDTAQQTYEGFIAYLNQLAAYEQSVNPGSAIGIVANRLPSLSYRNYTGFGITDIDAITGVQRDPFIRYDLTGRPYNAPAGSDQASQSLSERFIRVALARGAVAPMWEVQTAAIQTQYGDPQAGLTEEERAGRNGLLAPSPQPSPATGGGSQIWRPVALDLNGDGIQTTGTHKTVAFDVDDSGFLKNTAWLNPSTSSGQAADGFLFLDRNLNGSIDSGRELFSNSIVDLSARGLAGMRWIDSNYDGKLTSADPVWNELKVWQDADGNGQAEAGEVKSLSDLGITALDYAMGRFEQNGQLKQMSSPDLAADTAGTRTHVVPEGIVVETTSGHTSLLVTRIDDETVIEANRDGDEAANEVLYFCERMAA